MGALALVGGRVYTRFVSPSAARRSRPRFPDAYGAPTSPDGLLDWQHVATRLEQSQRYWLATSTVDGRPHAVPVDGIWLDTSLYFGGAETRWMRNVRANPNVAVHLDSSEDVVTLEGGVEFVDGPVALLRRVASASKAKYGFGSPRPCWAFTPKIVFAWTNLTKDPTRWLFD